MSLNKRSMRRPLCGLGRRLWRSAREHREGIVCAVARRKNSALLVLYRNGRAIELDMDAEFAAWLADQISPVRRSTSR